MTDEIRKKLEADIDAFFSKGGKVQHCDSFDNAASKLVVKTNRKGEPRYQGEEANHLAYNRRGGSR